MPLPIALTSLLRITHHHSNGALDPFTLSYNAMNLWIYFIIIPLVWTLVLDRKLQTKYKLTMVYTVCILIGSILKYKHQLDLLQLGVDFCVYMMKVHHCSYAESCVIWCVLVPLAITIILISLPSKTAAGKRFSMQQG